MRFLFRVLYLSALALKAADEPAHPIYVERVPVADGAELVTVFGGRSIRVGEHPGEEQVPLLSILRDTLDSPHSERLRQVWILTYSRPSIGQRLLAAIPFNYWRSGARVSKKDRAPKPVLDLSQPQLVTWSQLLLAAVQKEVLDGNGIAWRTPTRGYQANASEYRSMQIAEALQLLETVDESPSALRSLSEEEWDEIRGRLMLSRRLLGGLVSQSRLTPMMKREDRMLQMNRGHNWELLRQQAERNGLYFQPLSFSEPAPGYALVWIARSDLEKSNLPAYDGAFLGMTNPWTDTDLRTWKGYEETWYFAPDGTTVNSAEEGARAERMIPLGLYSLNYPPAPLLMADFRHPFKPKRKEMLARAADLTAIGVLGLTGYGNLGYAAARESFTWLRHRHGANTDRTSRVSAYAQLEHSLFFDDSVSPGLRAELEKQAGRLALNPFDRTQQSEVSIARAQYTSLLKYAREPKGLPALLTRERGREMTPLVHGKTSRVLFSTASVLTLGTYVHREKTTPEMLAKLQRQRRLEADARDLRLMLDSSPRIEVAWDDQKLTRVLDDIADLRPTSKEVEGVGMNLLITRVSDQTRDEGTKRRCLAYLSGSWEPSGSVKTISVAGAAQ